MATLVLPFGSRIAADTHIPSEPCTLPSPRTVADLLAHWKLFPPTQHAMLRTTCARLADYFGESVETISIDRVDDGRKGFRAFLEGRKYGENSVRTYVNHLRILLASANAVGWSRGELVSDEWRMVIGLSEVRKCGRLARHLSTLRKNPRDVTFDDTDQWVQQAAQESISFAAATKMRSNFWRVLRDSGIAKLLPTYLLRENNYRISISDFPDDLEKEVTDLISWKQKPYAWDRPKGAHHRAPTAKRLVYVISQLYGFAINIASYNELTRLTDLVQRHIVGAFTEWCITERQVKGQTLQRNLRLLSAALHQHPNYKDLELDWFKPFLDGLPTDSTAVLNKKKAEKTLPYTVIEAIPEKIRAERRTASAHARRHLAVRA